jgi:hypothetical protein
MYSYEQVNSTKLKIYQGTLYVPSCRFLRTNALFHCPSSSTSTKESARIFPPPLSDTNESRPVPVLFPLLGSELAAPLAFAPATDAREEIFVKLVLADDVVEVAADVSGPGGAPGNIPE